MFTLVHKCFQAYCRSGPHFMPAMKIVHRSLGNHEKSSVTIYVFFIMPTSLIKFESYSTW